MLTTSCTTASVEHAVYQDDSVYKHICKIPAERNDWLAMALITLHCNVKVNHSQINTGLLAQQTTSSSA